MYESRTKAIDKAQNIYERRSNHEGVAEDKYQRGDSLNIQEKLDEARAQFELVRNNPRANKHQQIRSMLQISSVCSSKGETTCAEDYASRAVALAKQERMENLASSGLIDLGNAYLAGRAYDKAEQNFLLAIDFSRQDGGARNEARALLAMGSLRIQQKRPVEAEDFVRQSLPFFEKGGYQKEIVQSNLILGRAAELQENLDLAVRAYTTVAGSEVASPADRAYAEMVIGNVLMKKEDYGAALRHAERGSDLYQALNNPYYTAHSLFNQIEILSLLGRFEDAGSRLSQVREIVQKSPSYQKQLLPRIQLLSAQIALRERNFAAAVKEADLALKSTDPYVQAEANKVLSLAQSYLSPRGKEEVEICQRALRAASDTKDGRAINDAKLTLSEVYLVTGSPREALEIVLPLTDYFESAGQLESAWRARLIAGQASGKTGNAENAKAFAAAALRIFGQLPGKLGEEHINSYRARPDIGFYYKEAEKLTGF
jgi:tetratricopeptide (TPR) repeat protein